MNETEISREVAEYLDKAGIFNLRLQSGTLKKGSRYVHLASTGCPDRLLIDRQRGCVFLEIKRPGQSPSPEQLNVHGEIERAGGTVLIVVSLADFLVKFNRLKKLCAK